MEMIVAHPFPLIHGGGLFLICVGISFLSGWMMPRYWIPLAISGFVLGFIASAFSPLLRPSLGTPSGVQIAALVGAIVLEIFLINYVVARYRGNERMLILGILLVVGVHFVVMGISHGPLMAGLGVVTVGNAWLGMRILPHVAVQVFGVVDSLLKIGCGLWMVLFFPAWG